MSQKYYTILTEKGAALLANATALGVPLKLSQMAVGDGNGTMPNPIASQTKLVNEVRRAAINTISIDENNPNQIIAEQVIPENEGGWFIHEIGLFDDKGNLIAVGNCPATYKPKLAEGSGRTQIIRMIIIVDNVDSVAIKIDPSVVLATREYVERLLSSHKATTQQSFDSEIKKLVPNTRKINNKELKSDIKLLADDINALPAVKKQSNGQPTYEVGEQTTFKKRPKLNESELITLNDFNQSFSNSGYAKLPNGLFIQWGLASYLASSGSSGNACPFYTAFPNRCISVVSNDGYAGVNSTATNPTSNTHFKCWGKSPEGRYADTGIFYIAIGY